MAEAENPEGPDLTQGIPLAELKDGTPVAGHIGDQAAMMVRIGGEILAVGAHCTHYGGPLPEGIVVGDTVRCPWHHACFSVRSGAPLRPPALNPLPRWRVEQRDGKAFASAELPAPAPAVLDRPDLPDAIVIIGGGAAGQVAAETLRHEGYGGPVTILSADAASPCDRPNLSKDYLAGTAEEDWIPLRPPEFYRDQKIELRLNTRVSALDPAGRSLRLADGGQISYGALLLATGAEPIALDVSGAGLPHVHLLRTLADSNAIIAAAGKTQNCVVVGASFIGLEVAASLRNRGLQVHVVAPEKRPMERVMGPALGDMIRTIHESHGVVFHLERTVAAIEPDSVTLSDGQKIAAGLVVVGIGVRPAVVLAEQAGLAMDHGVAVDEFLRTSDPQIYAAGDIARWPDRLTGQRIRVEHWVVAERQGQTAARNMLGMQQRFDAVPFFWSQHYDIQISYVGHAQQWDRIDTDGDPAKQDCALSFFSNGKRVAVVTVGRDQEALRAELELERVV